MQERMFLNILRVFHRVAGTWNSLPFAIREAPNSFKALGLTPRGLGRGGFFILITTLLKFLGHYLILIYRNPRNLFCPLTFYTKILNTTYTEILKNLRKLKNGGKLLQFLICELLASKKLFRYGICTIKVTLYNPNKQ